MFGLIKKKSAPEEQNLEINGSKYKLKVHLEKRRNARASISRSGINIRIPISMPYAWKQVEIEKLKKWAIEKIENHPNKFAQEKPTQYHSGQQIMIGGSSHIFNILEEERTKFFAKISGNNIEIRIPKGSSHKTGKILSKLVAKEFISFVQNRISELNQIHFRKPIGKIILKNNKSTWGSCSPRGDITIATKLLLAPREIIEYVFIHELAHLVVRGHSKKFWNVVEKALPDYKQKRKWLRKNSNSIRF